MSDPTTLETGAVPRQTATGDTAAAAFAPGSAPVALPPRPSVVTTTTTRTGDTAASVFAPPPVVPAAVAVAPPAAAYVPPASVFVDRADRPEPRCLVKSVPYPGFITAACVLAFLVLVALAVLTGIYWNALETASVGFVVGAVFILVFLLVVVVCTAGLPLKCALREGDPCPKWARGSIICNANNQIELPCIKDPNTGLCIDLLSG